MEKNRLLVASHYTLILTLLAVLVSSCALPKIRILHDPLTLEEHLDLGVSYERGGEFDAALAEYAVAAKRIPVALLYMGNVYFQKKDFENAELYFAKAIEETNDPRAYNNLAWLYYTQDRNLEAAEGLARVAVAADPLSGDYKDTLRKIQEKRKGPQDGP